VVDSVSAPARDAQKSRLNHKIFVNFVISISAEIGKTAATLKAIARGGT
jgi:hypothetical protein